MEDLNKNSAETKAFESDEAAASEHVKEETRFVKALKFIPLLCFAFFVIVMKVDILVAAPVSCFIAAAIHMILKKAKFGEVFEFGIQSTKNIVLVLFILMFANALAECFMATGVGAAIINISLSLGVTARTVPLVAFLVTCLLSVATGSSWGTFAACAPIFLWLSHLVGGNMMLMCGCIAGGSCFGDDLGLISDCTVLSCGLMEVKIIDRLKHQLVWAVSCMLVTCGVIYLICLNEPNTVVSAGEVMSQLPEDVFTVLAEERPSALMLLEQVESGVPWFMVLPMVIVIVMAFSGIHTLLCLGAGMISSLILGIMIGTTTFDGWLNGMIIEGFSSAGSWSVIMMMWVAAFGGIMNSMNAFTPLAHTIKQISRNVHQLMGWCGVLCLLGNAALADESAQIATISPIIRSVVEDNVECEDEKGMYRLRVRLATFASAMGIYGSELIPWHCFPVFFAGIASSVYPLMRFTSIDIVRCNYMSFIVVGSILILTFTGLDRFIPGFSLPRDARLKSE